MRSARASDGLWWRLSRDARTTDTMGAFPQRVTVGDPCFGLGLLRCMQCLLEVFDDIIDVLDTDAKSDHFGCDATTLQLICRQLPMRR